MTVALLIVNWNGGDLPCRCLQSVHEQRRPPDHVIVIDNASTDDSLARAASLLRTAIQRERRVSPWVLRRAFTRGIFAPYFARYR